MICLIDADILIYRSAFAVEKQCYKVLFSNGSKVDTKNRYTKTKIKAKLKKRELVEGDDYTLEGYKTYEPVENALFLCNLQIKKILEAMRTTEYKLYLTSQDKSNYRYNIAVTDGPAGKGYKAGRPAKPFYYKSVRDHILENTRCIEVFGMEADDALGIAQYNSHYKDQTVICTIDKDLDMIPGKHYNFATDEYYECSDPGELFIKGRKISGSGIKWFYAQMLLGDNCDNIPGIKGYGPVTVYNLLNHIKEEVKMVEKVYEVYYTKFKDKANARFLEVADLLWIQRVENERKSLFLKELL